MELYNERMQEWLENNRVLMYSANGEGKSLITEILKSIKK